MADGVGHVRIGPAHRHRGRLLLEDVGLLAGVVLEVGGRRRRGWRVDGEGDLRGRLILRHDELVTRVSGREGRMLGRFGFGCGRSEGCARRGRFVRGVERGGGILVKADLRAHGRAFRLLEGESEGLVVT